MMIVGLSFGIWYGNDLMGLIGRYRCRCGNEFGIFSIGLMSSLLSFDDVVSYSRIS